MDGDPVTGEPSANLTLTDVFVKLCPQYMAMGMSYDEFWNGPTILVKYYREAFEIKKRNEEWGRWRAGAYFYDALLRVSPILRAFGKGKVEPGKYPEEPWPLTQKEADERQAAIEKKQYESYIANMRANSDREKQRRAELAKDKEVNAGGGY